jgi:uncharacterized protein (TIGR03067 family)
MAVVVSTALLIAFQSDGQKADSLDGFWKLDSAERDGEKMKFDSTLEFKGQDYTIRAKGTISESGTYSVVNATVPFRLDFHARTGLYTGRSIPAIYAFDHARLIICVNYNKDDRPTAFTTRIADGLFVGNYVREGSGWILLIPIFIGLVLIFPRIFRRQVANLRALKTGE